MEIKNEETEAELGREETQLLLTGGKYVRVWDLHSLKCSPGVPPTHIQFVRSMKQLPNGIIAIAGSKFVFLWDWENQKLVGRLEAHTGSVRDIQYLGADLLASCSWDRTIRIWNYSTKDNIRTLEGHTANVMSICLVGRRMLVSVSEDGTGRVWDWTNGSCIQILSGAEGHTKFVNVVIPLGGAIVATGSADHTIKLWNVQNGRCVRTLSGHTGSVYCLMRWVAPKVSSSRDDPVRGSGGVVGGYLRRHSAQTTLWILSGSFDRTIRLWDAQNGLSLKTFTGHEQEVVSLVTISPRTFASGGNDRVVRIWNIHTGECVKVIPNQGDWVKSMLLIRRKRDSIEEALRDQVAERLGFLVDRSEEFFQLEVEFRNSTVRLSRALVLAQSRLDGASDRESPWSFPLSDCSPAELVVNAALFGLDDIVERHASELLELYVCFQLLDLRQAMYVVLKKLESILDLQVLLKLYVASKRRFDEFHQDQKDAASDEALESILKGTPSLMSPPDEEPIRERLRFESAFTLQLFNVLKRRIREIQTNPRYALFLEKLNSLTKLMEFRPRPLENHPDFAVFGPGAIRPEKTFQAIFETSLEKLADGQFSNLTLEIPGSEMKLPVHAEILVFQSEIFFRMFHFGGTETRSVRENRTVPITAMGEMELRLLVEFFYHNDFKKTDDLYVLFAILRAAETFNELRLKSKLVASITYLMETAFKKNLLEIRLLELGSAMAELPEHLQDRFFSIWFVRFGVPQPVMRGLVNFSSRVVDVLEDNERMRSQLVQRKPKDLDSPVDSPEKPDDDDTPASLVRARETRERGELAKKALGTLPLPEDETDQLPPQEAPAPSDDPMSELGEYEPISDDEEEVPELQTTLEDETDHRTDQSQPEQPL